MFKRMVAVVLVMVLAAAGALYRVKAQDHITGSGNVISETRQVSGFTAVDLRGVGEVNITQGEAEALTVTADDNILPLLTSEVVDGTLILSIKPDVSLRHTTQIQFDVTVINLAAVAMTGAGHITASDIASPDPVEIAMTGAGAIDFGGTVGDLSVNLSGAGNVVLDGQADNVTVNLSGAGNVDASALTINTALNVTLSGFGNVAYEGDAEINVTKTGLGSIGSLDSFSVNIPPIVIPEINIPAIEIPAINLPAVVIPPVEIPAVVIPEIVIPPAHQQ